MTTNRLLPTLALLLVVASRPRDLDAQRLQGRVIDTTTQEPVAGAALQLVAPDSTVALYGISDEAGGFTLIAQRAGEYVLKIAHLGYQQASLGPLPLETGKTLEITVALGPGASPVDTVAVAGAAARSARGRR